MKRVLAAGATFVSLLLSGSASAAPTITEFPTNGTNTGPLNIVSGADGNLWYTNVNTDQLERMTPAGVAQTPVTAGDHPFDIAARNARVWWTSQASQQISSLEYGSQFPTNLTAIGAAPTGITAGPSVPPSSLWYTLQGADKVGAKQLDGGNYASIDLPAGSSPADITAGVDRAMYVTAPGTDRIIRITLDGIGVHTMSNFDDGLAANADPTTITPGPDGRVWFVEPTTDMIGAMTTGNSGGAVTEYALPENAEPAGIIAGPDGAMWFTEPGIDKIGRITMDGTVTHFGGLTAGSRPSGITVGPDGNLWFTESLGSRIGRVALDPPQFSNPTALTFPIVGSAATPAYPSAIAVSGLTTPITDVNVRVNGLGHDWPDDVELLLVSPGGEKIQLMADNGGGSGPSGPAATIPERGVPVSGLSFTFDDSAPGTLPDSGVLTSGQFRPSDGTGTPNFPAPAPAGPYGSQLDALDGLVGAAVNGNWSLYVDDDLAGDGGKLTGGWGLDIDTANAVADEAEVTEDDAATEIDVLANDDVNFEDIATVSEPGHGTAAIVDGPDRVSYEPDPDYCNDAGGIPDTFTYTTDEGLAGTVSITVACVNDPAAAADDLRTVAEDAAATPFDVTANDDDPDGGEIGIASATDPAHGTVVVTQGSPDTLTYEPDDGYCNDDAAPDAFSYTLEDGGDSAAVAVTVTCAPPTPDPPPPDPDPDPGATVPETTITKAPRKLKAKGKSARARFEFTSSVAGASFECALDDAGFKQCTSPATVKVKKGKHTFAVAAIVAGAKDPTPATATFTVKAKRKKRK